MDNLGIKFLFKSLKTGTLQLYCRQSRYAGFADLYYSGRDSLLPSVKAAPCRAAGTAGLRVSPRWRRPGALRAVPRGPGAGSRRRRTKWLILGNITSCSRGLLFFFFFFKA